MEMLMPLLLNLLAGTLVWLLSLRLADVSIVDSLWSLMFWFATLYWLWPLTELSARAWLVLLMVSVWSWRLCLFLTVRNWGEPEDRRYRTIRANNQPGFWWKSWYLVFGLQAVLAWVASLVIWGALQPAPLGWLDALGVALWGLGFGIEVVADRQLTQFKRRGDRQAVLDSGLWRYSRHPNYFGECCLWWGLWLLALSAGGWWAVLSPLLLTLLLLKVSGVKLLESTIGERRPGYRDYVRRTNAFFPWFASRATAPPRSER